MYDASPEKLIVRKRRPWVAPTLSRLAAQQARNSAGMSTDDGVNMS